MARKKKEYERNEEMMIMIKAISRRGIRLFHTRTHAIFILNFEPYASMARS